MILTEPAPAKLNLALHVRGRRADGRHDIETIFAFCTDGDRVEGQPDEALSLDVIGPFANDLESSESNLVLNAANSLRQDARVESGAALILTKNLPVASGVGGGSADAAAALRLLTRLWNIDPGHAAAVAPRLGADVPACLLSMTARGTGVGDDLTLIGDSTLSGIPVLLVNPGIALSTGTVFGAWDGEYRGPLGDWRAGRNDLEAPARRLVPVIGTVLNWLGDQPGTTFTRMSGSGATCFALFADVEARDAAASACPDHWWHLASFLR